MFRIKKKKVLSIKKILKKGKFFIDPSQSGQFFL